MALVAPFCTKLLPRPLKTAAAPVTHFHTRPRQLPRPPGSFGAVYHDNDQCTVGNNIEAQNRIPCLTATLVHRTRCRECEALDRAAARAQAISNVCAIINRSRVARGMPTI